MHSISFKRPAGTARRSVHASSGTQALTFTGPLPQLLRGRSSAAWTLVLALLAGSLAIALSGCGAVAGGADATATGTLVASASTLAFGNVTVGKTASATLSLKNESADSVSISQIGVSGQYFALASQNTLPMTLAGRKPYGRGEFRSDGGWCRGR